VKSLNKVQLIGFTGKDAESRYTPNGTAVAEFSLATSESWKDKQTGDKKEKTEWHTVVVWGKLAEIAAEYIKKGMPLYVEGSLHTETFERDGKTQYRTKIRADNIIFLGKSESKPADKPADKRPAQPVKDAFDDDIPF
jgi:single-strand DNA-binding protein